MKTTLVSFKMGMRDLDSGPHACVTIILLTEQLFQSLLFSFCNSSGNMKKNSIGLLNLKSEKHEIFPAP